jgi:hypothetical protein
MNRGGFALLFVLLVIGAIQLLTLSTFALATHESILTQTSERTVVARRAAEASLQRLARQWPLPPPLDSLRVAQTARVSAGSGVVIMVTRHSWGLYEAVASASAGSSLIRRRMVLRKLDLQRLLSDANDAVVAAGFVQAHNALLSAADTRSCVLPVPTPRPARPLTVSAARYAVGLADAVVDSVHARPPAGYALAGARWSEIESVADVMAGSTLQMHATDTLGMPIVQLVYAPTDLTVSGDGIGMLIVNGDLSIESGATFAGVIVVRGNVIMSSDVRMSGSVRVQGTGATDLGTAQITYSRCAIAEALLESPAAARLINAERRFLPTF